MKVNLPMTDETTASLSGAAKTDALRALRVLAETTDPPAAEDTETPPLPAHLRDLWQETYGENAAARPANANREGWLQRLSRFLTTPRAAWAGGLAAAAAAIAILVSNHDPATGGPSGEIITRGGAHVTDGAGSAAPLIVIGPADKTGLLLAELAKAFPSRQIERMDIPPAGQGGDAIIIDPAAGKIGRAGQPAGTELIGDAFANPEAVILAVEGLDEPEPR